MILFFFSVYIQIVAALVGYIYIYKLYGHGNIVPSLASKTPAIHANIDLEEFKHCNGAEGLYVLHRDLGKWYFSFQELATVVSREVHSFDL